jgi:Tfp pilus assembly protein PilN
MSIINLLPEDYVKRRSQRRANKLCLVLFAAVMVGVGGAAAVSERSTRNTLAVAKRVDAAYADAAKMIEQLRELETRKQAMLHKAELTASLLERVPRSTLLAIVASALPRGASLTQLSLFPQNLVTRTEPANKEVQAADSKFAKIQQQRAPTESVTIMVIEATGLAGTDVEVARFIANLVRCPLMKSVDLVYSQQKLVGTVPVREFQVKMELKPNVDVIDALRSARGRAPLQPLAKAQQEAAKS